MCDVCVINSVKKRMISRRHLLQSAVAAGAAAAASPVLAPAPAVAAQGTVLDLTHELYEEFPTYFGNQQFFREQKFNWAEHKFNIFELRVNEHTGTHMDALLHFSEDGQSVAEIPVENLVVPLCVIDIKARAAENPDAQVTPDDIQNWIWANGPIPEKACVAMNSGWDKHLGS